jgi:hypothetical protein
MTKAQEIRKWKYLRDVTQQQIARLTSDRVVDIAALSALKNNLARYEAHIIKLEIADA